MSANTEPRKRPSRRSGEDIVASILDAGSSLLMETGLEPMTTNAIAKRAGVSIGSLYQYFPSKEAVIAGVARRINQKVQDGIRAALEQEGSAEERVHNAIQVFCSSSVGDVALRRRLLAEVPRSWDHTAIEEAEEEVFALFGPVMNELFPAMSEAALHARKVAMIFAVRGAVQGALLYAPELLEDGRLGQIVSDLVLSARRRS
ncbi:MAG: TetR/AcrR family transcriptional regulator [Polyangiales bacterium]